jgi:macrolide-specific efflux system membrane fusion protein
MYAKVLFTVDRREKALVVPANAVVDVGGGRGVFMAGEGDVARFKAIETGLVDQNLVEVASGLAEGEQIVTTGAAALREGDRIVLLGQAPDAQGEPAGGQRGVGRGRGARGSGPAAGRGQAGAAGGRQS